MGLFTEDRLINRFKSEIRKGGEIHLTENARALKFINESKSYQRLYSAKQYDIFLSHSSVDARLVAGLKLELEDLGYSVYVDWIEDPELNRANVTKENAEILRSRMKQCSTMLYAFSKNASQSTWMPWELGYFDGIKGKVAVVPISETVSSTFNGNEYLKLYPYADISTITNGNGERIWINESSDTYVEYDKWINGVKPYKRK